VYDRHVLSFGWSPDGRWLVCNVQSAQEFQEDLSSLVAVSVDGGEPVTLIEKANIGRFCWATDGAIYFWERDAGIRQRLAPPSSWTSANAAPFEPHAALLPVHDPTTNRWVMHRFTAGSQTEDVVLDSLDRPAVQMAADVARFPDGQRWLLRIYERHRSPYSVVVDRDGHTLATLGESAQTNGFSATSVSPDGRFVVGHQEQDDGQRILASRVYLSNATGTWRTVLADAPRGLNPQFSPRDFLIAFRDPLSGSIYVGTIQIQAR
jgi:hypothetical protein